MPAARSAGWKGPWLEGGPVRPGTREGHGTGIHAIMAGWWTFGYPSMPSSPYGIAECLTSRQDRGARRDSTWSWESLASSHSPEDNDDVQIFGKDFLECLSPLPTM